MVLIWSINLLVVPSCMLLTLGPRMENLEILGAKRWGSWTSTQKGQ